MRRILSALVVTAVLVGMTGAAALAQGEGGAGDTRLPGPAQERPEDVEAGRADETSGKSSVPGWLLSALAAGVVIGGIAFIVWRGTRDDSTVRA